MTRMIRSFLCALALCGAATAQSTWIVQFGGGPGVDFTDLPSAVAAAADGDTIIVQQAFGFGATPFTTSKGLTIIGEGGAVNIQTQAWNPIVIQNLPVGSSFRMAGFSKAQEGGVNVRILDCKGEVHLQDLEAREPQAFFTTSPSIEVLRSASVTLSDVRNFGAPAILADQSVVTVVDCWLQVMPSTGLGGGAAIEATTSTIHIVQPHFSVDFGVQSSIATVGCTLSITGDPTSSIHNTNGDLIFATGGQIELDPAVTLSTGVGFSAFSGSAPVTTKALPASWTSDVHPGQSMALTTWAPPGAHVFQAIGEPGLLTTHPFGLLGIDITQGFFYLPTRVAPASGVVQWSLPVPASLAAGSAFTTQALIATGISAELGKPCTFVAD
ncbi:MAG: hypothetical protein P1V81_17455 [Planctomycetota bacterium]|nr:hypothetical protein [Planctomycetota bacterium]